MRRRSAAGTLAAAVWLAAGCGTGDGAGAPVAGPDASDVGDDTPTFACEAPADLPADPLWLVDQVDVSEEPGGYILTHLVDLVPSPDEGLLYAVGVGGLHVFATDGDTVELVAIQPIPQRLHHIALLEPGRVAVTGREAGLVLFDTSDLADIQSTGFKPLTHTSGLVESGGLLHVAGHDGLLFTIDYTSAAFPQTVNILEGLANAWQIVAAEDVAYVADSQLGVVVLDLSVPHEPQILTSLPEAVGAQDVVLEGDRLVVASGSGGVLLVDVSDPTSPALLGTADTGGPVLSVAAAGDVVWATDQENVVVLDASDPTAPRVVATQETDEWAMHVHVDPATPDGRRAWVANWRKLDVYRFDPAVEAPDADVDPGIVYLPGGGGEVELTITNRGAAPLTLMAAGSDDPALTVDASGWPHEVAPGEQATLPVTVDGVAGELDAAVCVITDDPDEPTTLVPIRASNDDAFTLVGDPAPDFALADATGQLYALSDYLGEPVLLLFFASW